MKKIAVTLSLLAVAAGAYAQGLVGVANGTSTQFRTNSTAIGGTAGLALSASGPGYFYEVLSAPSTVTTIDSSLQALFQSGTPWVDSGLTASNTTFAGRENAGSGNVNGWAAGETRSFIIVGWSGSEGTTWASLAAKLNGATLSGGMWTGGTLVNGGWVGATSIGNRQAGGLVSGNTIPTPSLFGTASDAQGTPIIGTTDLFVVAPEPTSFALVGLGAAAMMIFRRRKS